MRRTGSRREMDDLQPVETSGSCAAAWQAAEASGLLGVVSTWRDRKGRIDAVIHYRAGGMMVRQVLGYGHGGRRSRRLWEGLFICDEAGILCFVPLGPHKLLVNQALVMACFEPSQGLLVGLSDRPFIRRTYNKQEIMAHFLRFSQMEKWQGDPEALRVAAGNVQARWGK